MSHAKFQDHMSSGSVGIFLSFLPYLGTVAILIT